MKTNGSECPRRSRVPCRHCTDISVDSLIEGFAALSLQDNDDQAVQMPRPPSRRSLHPSVNAAAANSAANAATAVNTVGQSPQTAGETNQEAPKEDNQLLLQLVALAEERRRKQSELELARENGENDPEESLSEEEKEKPPPFPLHGHLLAQVFTLVGDKKTHKLTLSLVCKNWQQSVKLLTNCENYDVPVEAGRQVSEHMHRRGFRLREHTPEILVAAAGCI